LVEKDRKVFPAAATILSAMTELVPVTKPGEPAGEPLDWGSALATHERWLRTAVLARLGEHQAADEVLQEVALAAVAQRSPLADPNKLAAWLYRLAVRQTLLYRRRQGRRHRLTCRYAIRNGEATAGAQVVDPLAWLLLDERRQLVRAALERLTRRDAEILLLKYTEDWSYRELATHLGLTEAAVEARLHRARTRLRAALVNSSAIEVRE
jgi:RNA polymerase sigma-70 factor (ECF subfamily)